MLRSGQGAVRWASCARNHSSLTSLTLGAIFVQGPVRKQYTAGADGAQQPLIRMNDL